MRERGKTPFCDDRFIAALARILSRALKAEIESVVTCGDAQSLVDNSFYFVYAPTLVDAEKRYDVTVTIEVAVEERPRDEKCRATGC